MSANAESEAQGGR